MRRLALLLAATLALTSAEKGPWKPADLTEVPQTFQIPQNGEPGVKAIWFAGLPYKGKPTRVFAYYGTPANTRPGEKLPAMVLIHGGGGTAFAEWVRLWNARGYAAIAMDTTGAIPDKATDEKTKWNPTRKRTEFSAPNGWGDFANVDLAPEDQWSYHAVAAAIRAHSLIRSYPEIDPKRIGVTGISWGGYLTAIVSGLDHRFRFAAPVYGCGFLGEDSAWLKDFAKLGPDRAKRWLTLWDPSEYLPNSKMPMLWVNGTNDFAYTPPSWRKSHRLPKGPKTLAYRVRMPHGHPPGAKPEEILLFADHMLRKGPAPAKIKAQSTNPDGTIQATFKSKLPIQKAELAYTNDTGKWQDRKWETQPANLTKGKATAKVPTTATAWFLNLYDNKDHVVSTEHETR